MKQKNGKSRPPVKRKGRARQKPRKLSLKDKIFVIGITGALVTAALAISLALVIRNQMAPSAPEEAEKRVEAPPAEEAGTETESGYGAAEKTPTVLSSAKHDAREPKPVELTSGTPQSGTPETSKPQTAVPQNTVPPSSAAGNTLPPAKTPVPQRDLSQDAPQSESLFSSPAGLPSERASGGKLVFVIDDAGNNLRELEPFLKFPGPMTIAVLPGLPYSAEAARRARAAGKEVFLHQPMESLGGSNPGPGAVYAGMEEAEIRFIINRNLDEIWPAAGINNHEGSKVTMDNRIMEIVLDICRERGIVFLDSRTTAETAAPLAAAAMGLSIGERDVFLDNEQTRDSIIAYLDTAFRKAEQRGKAVMIGHAWSPELAPLLSEIYPDMEEKGFTLSTASELIKAEK